jgi:hypothetical protein
MGGFRIPEAAGARSEVRERGEAIAAPIRKRDEAAAGELPRRPGCWWMTRAAAWPQPLARFTRAAALELLEHAGLEAVLGLHHAGLRETRVERARHVLAVQARRVDRLLQVCDAVVHEIEEEGQGPLVLLIAARRAEAENAATAS